MAGQNEGGAAATGTGASGAPNPGTTEPNAGEALTLDKIPQEILDQINAKAEEKFKAEISSRDKKITDYQKAIKEKELEGKTEKEKAELAALQKEKELQEKEAELEVAQANFLKTKIAADEKLDPSVVDLIAGRSQEEIKASVAKVKAVWNKAKQAGIDEALKGTTTTPRRPGEIPGGTNLTQLQAQLAEAKKNGNQALALKLLKQIEDERQKT